MKKILLLLLLSPLCIKAQEEITITFDDFKGITYEEKYYPESDIYYLQAKFDKHSLSLDGKDVAISGYLHEVDAEEHFYMLTPRPFDSYIICMVPRITPSEMIGITCNEDVAELSKNNTLCTFSGKLKLNSTDPYQYTLMLNNAKIGKVEEGMAKRKEDARLARISFDDFKAITFTETKMDSSEMTWQKPTFSEYLKSLDGKEVEITGYLHAIDRDMNFYMLVEKPDWNYSLCVKPVIPSAEQVDLRCSESLKLYYNKGAACIFSGKLKLNDSEPYQAAIILENAQFKGEAEQNPGEPTKISFKDFKGINYKKKFHQEQNLYYNHPTFDEHILSLNGKRVTISGYCIPFDRRTNSFFLQRKPYEQPDCWGKQEDIYGNEWIGLEGSGLEELDMNKKYTFSGILVLNQNDINKMVLNLKDVKVVSD